jgi:hypothetical protein
MLVVKPREQQMQASVHQPTNQLSHLWQPARFLTGTLFHKIICNDLSTAVSNVDRMTPDVVDSSLYLCAGGERW